jgi:hypothetical protein
MGVLINLKKKGLFGLERIFPPSRDVEGRFMA